ncbi:hypothetical protein Hanom_Chr12g01150151 [Helianthus anomalus]
MLSFKRLTNVGAAKEVTHLRISPTSLWRLRYVRHSMVLSPNNQSSHEVPGKVLKPLLLKF